jgi:hypothetical protein
VALALLVAACSGGGSNSAPAPTATAITTQSQIQTVQTRPANAAHQQSQAVAGTHPRNDFLGNGTSDLLWRNGTTGQVFLMPMSGGVTLPGGIIWTEPSPAWQIVGTGDFYGNGKAEILWWNSSTGQVFLMQPNGTNQASGSIIYTEPNTNWRIVGVADFTADGKADILWRNFSTGQVYLMPMNGSTVLPGAVIWTEPNMAWQIVATDRFMGTSVADVLWWNSSTGQVFLMQPNGINPATGSIIYTEPNTNWKIVGSGDFNGDGHSDVLWRNVTTGQVYEMPMLSGVPQTGGMIWTEPSLGWQILAIGDFNGDGNDDIIWWNSSTGQIFQMLMYRLTVISSGVIYTEPNTAWTLQAGGTHTVSRTTAADPEGIYCGTFTVSRAAKPMIAAVTATGEFRFATTDDWVGSATLSGSTGSGTLYTAKGGTPNTLSLTNVVVTPGASITGSYAYGSSTGTFSLISATDPKTGVVLYNNPTMELPVTGYTTTTTDNAGWQSSSYPWTGVNVDASGNISMTVNKATVTGTLTQLSSGVNLYRINLTFANSGAFTGLGWWSGSSYSGPANGYGWPLTLGSGADGFFANVFYCILSTTPGNSTNLGVAAAVTYPQ